MGHPIECSLCCTILYVLFILLSAHFVVRFYVLYIPLSAHFVVPFYMFCIGLMMAELRPKHVALM